MAGRKDSTKGFEVKQIVRMTREGTQLFRIISVDRRSQCIEAVSLADGTSRRAHPCNYLAV